MNETQTSMYFVYQSMLSGCNTGVSVHCILTHSRDLVCLLDCFCLFVHTFSFLNASELFKNTHRIAMLAKKSKLFMKEMCFNKKRDKNVQT